MRRANTGQDGSILDAIPEGVTLLPNTSGARTADEAVRIARLARAMGCGDFVKVEVIRDAAYLMPDNAETVRATAQLVEEGFVVLPYMANTAVATAGDVPLMAAAFKRAVEAGRAGYRAGMGRVLDRAEASSPLTGFLAD